MTLIDEVVAIAGAAGGLGPTVAHASVESGARLVVAGRIQADLLHLLDALGLPNDRRLASVVDLTDAPAMQAWAAQSVAALGRVDVARLCQSTQSQWMGPVSHGHLAPRPSFFRQDSDLHDGQGCR